MLIMDISFNYILGIRHVLLSGKGASDYSTQYKAVRILTQQLQNSNTCFSFVMEKAELAPGSNSWIKFHRPFTQCLHRDCDCPPITTNKINLKPFERKLRVRSHSNTIRVRFQYLGVPRFHIDEMFRPIRARR